MAHDFGRTSHTVVFLCHAVIGKCQCGKVESPLHCVLLLLSLSLFCDWHHHGYDGYDGFSNKMDTMRWAGWMRDVVWYYEGGNSKTACLSFLASSNLVWRNNNPARLPTLCQRGAEKQTQQCRFAGLPRAAFDLSTVIPVTVIAMAT